MAILPIIHTNRIFNIDQLDKIGPKTYEKFKENHIVTNEDLIQYVPTHYKDYQLTDLTQIEDGQQVNVVGLVYQIGKPSYYAKRRSRTIVRVYIKDIPFKLIFFNQVYLIKQLTVEQEYIISGKINLAKQEITVNRIKIYDHEHNDEKQTLEPHYRKIKEISTKTLQHAIHQALDMTSGYVELPIDLVKKYKLTPLDVCYETIHRSQDSRQIELAKRSIKFYELFMFQLYMQYKKHNQQLKDSTEPLNVEIDELSPLINHLPFELTIDQKTVVETIIKDFNGTHLMNRLVQGDVGSGKTIVALIAMYAIYLKGYQSAFMAPTEILATQHLEGLKSFVDQCQLSVKIELLTSSTPTKERKRILSGLSSGEIDIIIGTHALLTEDVEFDQLKLVITDEQHRFGVRQRSILKDKGQGVHVIMMTATPIPRTLSYTAMGDLNVSLIQSKPAGRKPIITRWFDERDHDDMVTLLKDALNERQQVFVVAPLIEDSDMVEAHSAESLYYLYQQLFNHHSIGLMHGKLKSDEKDELMQQFIRHDIDILISTTVIEVGVNVPNASLMIIYNADRFGLSTLHQLRGRVGRGHKQSYCYLVASPKTETGIQRMKIMEQSEDGFYIAEKDLEMRGPGDFLGVKQSGLPDFQFAHLVEDYKMVMYAHLEAEYYINHLTDDLKLWLDNFKPELEA